MEAIFHRGQAHGGTGMGLVSGDGLGPLSPGLLWDHQVGCCRGRTKEGIRSSHRCLELGGDLEGPWTWDFF